MKAIIIVAIVLQPQLKPLLLNQISDIFVIIFRLSCIRFSPYNNVRCERLIIKHVNKAIIFFEMCTSYLIELVNLRASIFGNLAPDLVNQKCKQPNSYPDLSQVNNEEVAVVDLDPFRKSFLRVKPDPAICHESYDRLGLQVYKNNVHLVDLRR